LPTVLFPLAAAASGPQLALIILVLCVVAGIGTVLLMPGRREASINRIGGVIVLAAGLVGAALLARTAAAYTSGDVYFWIFAAIAVLASIRVISHPKPVYSALYFVLAVMASAGLFVLLWAEFMAAALVLIYAGAILVTYVFVIMLASQAHTGKTGEVSGAEYDAVSREPRAAAAVGFALMGVLLFVIFDKSPAPGGGMTQALPRPGQTQRSFGQVNDLAIYLFRDQAVNLELAGLILMLAMVGAIVVARKRVASETPLAPERVDTPATPVNDDPHSIPVYGTTNASAKAFPER